jgi:hypothetical protein
VFDHEDGVGAGRDGSSGHDLDGLVGGKSGAGPELAGAELADDFEVGFRVPIGGAEGEAVAGGAVEGGLVAIREERGGEDAGLGLKERKGIGLDGASGGFGLSEDDLQSLLEVDDAGGSRAHVDSSRVGYPPLTDALIGF